MWGGMERQHAGSSRRAGASFRVEGRGCSMRAIFWAFKTHECGGWKEVWSGRGGGRR